MKEDVASVLGVFDALLTVPLLVGLMRIPIADDKYLEDSILTSTFLVGIMRGYPEGFLFVLWTLKSIADVLLLHCRSTHRVSLFEVRIIYSLHNF